MGRLTKAKIDEIAKLREKGYTQKEVAQRVGVHVRTVRNYDPLHQARPSKRRSVEDKLKTLEEALSRFISGYATLCHRVLNSLLAKCWQTNSSSTLH